MKTISGTGWAPLALTIAKSRGLLLSVLLSPASCLEVLHAACGVLTAFRLSASLEDLIAAAQATQPPDQPVQRAMKMAPGDADALESSSRSCMN